SGNADLSLQFVSDSGSSRLGLLVLRVPRKRIERERRPFGLPSGEAILFTSRPALDVALRDPNPPPARLHGEEPPDRPAAREQVAVDQSHQVSFLAAPVGPERLEHCEWILGPLPSSP